MSSEAAEEPKQFLPKFAWVRLALREFPPDRRLLAIELYEWLLDRARWKEPGRKQTRQGHWVDCDIGQAVMGRHEAAEELLGCRKHSQQIRTMLRDLRKAGVISFEAVLEGATNVGTRVTLIGCKEFWTDKGLEQPTVPRRRRNPFGYAEPRNDHPESDRLLTFAEALKVDHQPTPNQRPTSNYTGEYLEISPGDRETPNQWPREPDRVLDGAADLVTPLALPPEDALEQWHRERARRDEQRHAGHYGRLALAARSRDAG
jgi:hypothetical protein